MQRLDSQGRRGQTAAVIVSLAVGIAGVTGAYAVIREAPTFRSLLSRDQWVWPMVENRERGVRTVPRLADYEASRRTLRSFDRLVAYRFQGSVIRTDLGALELQAVEISQDYLPLSGPLAAGRSFDREELEAGDRVVILSESLARSMFAGARKALGREITVDGRRSQVIGVAAADYGHLLHPGQRGDLWRPLTRDPEAHVHVAARIREHLPYETAAAEVTTWWSARRDETGGDPETSWVLVPPAEILSTATQRMLEVALLAGILLILVTSSNVAHLLAARAEAERGQVATRCTLGATRLALARWKLADAARLALPAGLVGTLIASLGLSALGRLAPPDLDFLGTLDPDLEVLGFALGSSFVIVFLAGALPTLRRTRIGLAAELRGASRSGSGSSGIAGAVRHVHTATMTAVAVALLVASYLVIRQAEALGEVDLGLDVEGVQLVEVSLPEVVSTEPHRSEVFFREVADRLVSLAGVQSVVGSSPAPLGLGMQLGEIRFSDDGTGESMFGIGAASVTPGYFRTLGQEVLAGRGFGAEDLRPGAEAIVVSETTARELGSKPREALGKVIRFDDEVGRIVGVVEDTRNPGSPDPFGTQKVYWPMTSHDSATTFLLTGEIPPEAALRRIVAEIDPDAVVVSEPLTRQVERSFSNVRFLSLVFGVLTALAVALALFGVYATISYTLARSRRHLALRMALGASRERVRNRVLRQALGPSLIGLTAGLLMSYPLARLIQGQLEGIEIYDPEARVVASFLLIVAVGVAIWIPCLRIRDIDLAHVLKGE